jgi:hypothetical protein
MVNGEKGAISGQRSSASAERAVRNRRIISGPIAGFKNFQPYFGVAFRAARKNLTFYCSLC